VSALPSSTPTVRTYEKSLFASLFAAEDQHFWFQARNRILEAAISPLEANWENGYRVLEVGCGTGFVLEMLERLCRRGKVVGLDPFEEGLDFARQRTHCQVVQGDVYNWPFQDPFQLVGLFDVLEHLEDDIGALKKIRGGLAPGGHLVLTVPAHMSLWSYADTQACHCRRYSPEKLTDALQTAGFTVEYLTQFMGLLFPLAWVTRRWSAGRSVPGADCARDRERFLKELRVIPLLNGILRRLLSLEALLVRRRWHCPLGTSLLAIARPR